MSKNRVVITGMGAITPLGNTVTQFWDHLKSVRNRLCNKSKQR